MIEARVRPATDSHFRLLPCGCEGDAEYLGFDTGMWAVGCTVCGHQGRLYPVRHTAQVTWNGGERANG